MPLPGECRVGSNGAKLAPNESSSVLDRLRGFGRWLGTPEARKVLIEGDGRFDQVGHLDPRLLELFEQNHEGFAEIWDRLAG